MLLLFLFTAIALAQKRDLTAPQMTRVSKAPGGAEDSRTVPVGGNKRVVDSVKHPSFRGGGILPKNIVERLGGGAGERLLELGEGEGAPSKEPLPESYSFLKAFPACGEKSGADYLGQGSCNSCWAFATWKMAKLRACRSNARGEGRRLPVNLTPLGLVCTVQHGGLCAPQSIQDALEYLRGEGLGVYVEKSLKDLLAEHVTSNVNVAGRRPEDLIAADENDGFAESDPNAWLTKSRPSLTKDEADLNQRFWDASNPKPGNCAIVRRMQDYGARVKSALRVSLPGARDLQRHLLSGGPMVVTMRLTWQFLTFTKSFFDVPARELVFCRMATDSDTGDACSPERIATDPLLRDQQVRPAGMSQDEWEESWYNHFVVATGWGVTRDGRKYWSIENSWGDIYDKDPADLAEIDVLDRAVGTTHVKIADAIAGRGGLEIVTRNGFAGVNFVTVEPKLDDTTQSRHTDSIVHGATP